MAQRGWAYLFGCGPGCKVSDSFEIYQLPYCDYAERKLFPIGGDGSGNNYVLDLSLGDASPIYFSDVEGGEFKKYVVSSGFLKFIWFIVEQHYLSDDDISWPFDREYVLKHDPGIVKCGFRLPWDV